MRQPAAEGVRRFIAAAIDKMGKQEALRALASRTTGKPVATRTVSAWKTAGNTPGPTLFALARELRMSLDEYALDEEDRRSLAARLQLVEDRTAVVQELHDRLGVVQRRLDEALEVLGRDPLEFPGA